MRFTIDRLDHLVLNVTDIELAAAWYQRVLGMEVEEFILQLGEDDEPVFEMPIPSKTIH